MKKIECKVHGLSESVLTDSLLLRYTCKECKQALEKSKKLHFTKVNFENRKGK